MSWKSYSRTGDVGEVRPRTFQQCLQLGACLQDLHLGSCKGPWEKEVRVRVHIERWRWSSVCFEIFVDLMRVVMYE
jgi:hypothetical protein